MLKANERLLISISELSDWTGIAVGTLYHWAADGRLPCVRLSQRCLRFRVSDVDAWIANLGEGVKSHSDNYEGTNFKGPIFGGPGIPDANKLKRRKTTAKEKPHETES